MLAWFFAAPAPLTLNMGSLTCFVRQAHQHRHARPRRRRGTFHRGCVRRFPLTFLSMRIKSRSRRGLSMNRIFLASLLIAFVSPTRAAELPPIYTAGDATVCFTTAKKSTSAAIAPRFWSPRSRGRSASCSSRHTISTSLALSRPSTRRIALAVELDVDKAEGAVWIVTSTTLADFG
jgi:hypothetical protein